MNYLGIDPGLSGALCLYQADGVFAMLDMPTIERKVNGKVKRQLDPYTLGNWLDVHRNGVKFATVEEVGSMPSQGVTSSFNFGFSTGVIHGAVAANQIPLRTVRPGIWKKEFGLLGQDKDASRMAASRLAPHLAHHWPLKKHDGRAEAFLLAVYGSRMQ
jgi:hypothetical protein